MRKTGERIVLTTRHRLIHEPLIICEYGFGMGLEFALVLTSLFIIETRLARGICGVGVGRAGNRVTLRDDIRSFGEGILPMAQTRGP
jgi:hypothetical protein